MQSAAHCHTYKPRPFTREEREICYWRWFFVVVAVVCGLAALPWTAPWFESLWRFLKPGVANSVVVKLHILRAGLITLSVGIALLALIPSRWLELRALPSLLLGCLVLFGGAALTGSIRMATLSDRVVVEPDLSEYVAGSRSVWLEGRFGFEVNGHRLPSQYPPGVSLSYAAFTGLFGPKNAGFGSLFFGVAAIVIVALGARSLYRRVATDETLAAGGRIAAMLAVVFLAGSPAALKFFAQPLSEAPSVALVALAGLIVLTGKPTPLRAAALGFVASTAVAVRFSNAVILAPLVLFFSLISPLSPARFLVLLGCAALPAGFLASHLSMTFGSVFQTGYDFWNNGAYAPANFALSYALGAPGGGDTWLPNAVIYTFQLVAIPVNPFSALWLPGTAALTLLALKRGAAPPPYAHVAGLSLLFTLVLFIPYSYQDSRFLLPLLPLGAMVLAPAIATRFLAEPTFRRYAWLGLMVSSLCLACGIAHGYANWLRAHPSKSEFAADVAAHTESNAAIVSPLDAATFFSFVTVDSRLYVPASLRLAHADVLERHGITFGAVEHLDRLIELARARPVYLDTRFADRHPEALDHIHASLSWQPVGSESALLRLVASPVHARGDTRPAHGGPTPGSMFRGSQ
jgi:hypothetical protein